jgi:hypothetical protein
MDASAGACCSCGPWRLEGSTGESLDRRKPDPFDDGGCARGGCGMVVRRYLRSSLPSELPRASDGAIDARVLAVTMGLSVVIGLVLGLVPARQFVGAAASTVLVGQQRSGSADRGAVRLRDWLVVAEVALAAVLLVGAALFASSFMRVTRVGLGPRLAIRR